MLIDEFETQFVSYITEHKDDYAVDNTDDWLNNIIINKLSSNQDFIKYMITVPVSCDLTENMENFSKHIVSFLNYNEYTFNFMYSEIDVEVNNTDIHMVQFDNRVVLYMNEFKDDAIMFAEHNISQLRNS